MNTVRINKSGVVGEIKSEAKGWLTIVDCDGIEHKERKANVTYIEEQDAHDESEADEPEYSSKMAKALAQARPHYTKAVASSGKKSLHNGDELATKLQGCEPEEVCLLADLVCQEVIGTHYARYAHLNQGQQRMNAGNKIRGRVKRGEILPSTVIELADHNLPTLQAVADSE